MSYILEPEVPGELGEQTIIDNSVHPPIVLYLHFVFKGWMGDDLVECFPVFLISGYLSERLSNSDLTGFKINSCKIEYSKEFQILHPKGPIPQFYWLSITGDDKADFFVSKDFRLTVSEKAFLIVKEFRLDFCDMRKI
jgi:hypothetical protein